MNWDIQCWTLSLLKKTAKNMLSLCRLKVYCQCMCSMQHQDADVIFTWQRKHHTFKVSPHHAMMHWLVKLNEWVKTEKRSAMQTVPFAWRRSIDYV